MSHRFRTTVRRATLAAALALLATGCSLLGERESVPDDVGSSYVPADALAYVRVEGDLDGEAWQQAVDLVGRIDPSIAAMPPRRAVFVLLGMGQAERDQARDIEPLLGDTFGIAVIPTAAAEGESPTELLGWAEVADQARAEVILTAETQEAERYRGYPVGSPDPDSEDPTWWAVGEGVLIVGESESMVRLAIDAHEEGRSVEDDETYRRFDDDLDDDQLATGYVNGEMLRRVLTATSSGEDEPIVYRHPRMQAFQSLGFRVMVEEDGVRLEGEALYDDEVLDEQGAPLGEEPVAPMLQEPLPVTPDLLVADDGLLTLLESGLLSEGDHHLAEEELAAGMEAAADQSSLVETVLEGPFTYVDGGNDGTVLRVATGEQTANDSEPLVRAVQLFVDEQVDADQALTVRALDGAIELQQGEGGAGGDEACADCDVWPVLAELGAPEDATGAAYVRGAGLRTLLGMVRGEGAQQPLWLTQVGPIAGWWTTEGEDRHEFGAWLPVSQPGG